MKSIRILFLVLAAVLSCTISKAQDQPKTGYSVIATSPAEFLSNVQIDGKLEVDNELPSSTSAVLDIRSDEKGFLVPRLTTAQRDAISSPANGLLIYNTSTDQFNFYNRTAWDSIPVGSNTPTGDHNTLDEAYDEGGAGAGRTITADAGAVEITGGIISDKSDLKLVNDSLNLVSNNPFSGSMKQVGSGYSVSGVGDFTAVGGTSYDFRDGFISLSRQSASQVDSTLYKIRTSTADTNASLNLWVEPNDVDQTFSLSSSIGYGSSGFEAQIEPSGTLAAKMYATNTSGSSNLSVITVDTTQIKLKTDVQDVVLKIDSDEFSFESTQALMYPPRMTSTQVGLITPADGATVYVTDTNGTFTSIGFWGYVNGTWEKLD